MQTLSFGFKKPENLDGGSVVFPALEANWQQVNDHDHNGINSKKINAAYVEKTTVNILAAGWVLVADGHYTQSFTLPLNLQYDDVTLTFRLTNGDEVHPTVTKASATQVMLAFDDNTQSLVCLIN